MTDDRVRPLTAIQRAMLRWGREHGDRGALATDTELRVQSWNNWLTTATGIPAEAAIGQSLFDLFPSLVERGFDQYYAEALSGQIKVLSHSLHRFIIPTIDSRSGRQMPQRAQIGPLVDDDSIVGTITVIDDVSERVATELELRARIANAERARAMAEAASRVKDEFLATLSHEIRTPLNAVLGWTRILRSREFDQATVQRAVDVIDRNASAQLTLVSDMLDMARIASGKIRLDVTDLDLSQIALAAIDVVRPAAEAKGVGLATELSANLPLVSGDRDRLLQIVWNLLSNAVKFTDPAGQVTIGLDVDADAVRLWVTDTGHGIAPEFLPQVFERFRQADASAARRHGGLGLGLALARELVELHGGSIRAESAGPGHGSTFTVRLPGRRVGMEMERSPIEAPTDGVALKGIHVLVVEDDDDAREIIVRAITDVGASATGVTAASEALAMLRERAAAFHVVVTDIGMPGADGYSFLRELRKLPPEQGGTLPTIAVTAYVGRDDRRRALQAGFAAHIAKPFAPLTLVSTIKRAVTNVR